MAWLQDNWFKLALVLVIPITTVVLIYGFVIYPERIRQQEKAAEQIRADFEAIQAKAREEERVENLKSCLDNSESQETYAHLAYCGSNNRAPQWCSDVYSGAENILDVINNLKDVKTEKYLAIEEAFDQCNCSLEGWIRDGFKEDKADKDKQCYSIFGKE